MKYISTRGSAPKLGFEDVLLTGLASDGGLYVPETLPQFSEEQIASWAGLPYHELAFHIVSPFIGDAIEETALKKILKETYDAFSHKAVAPLAQLDHNEYVLELFHGPTLAFKDFALQLLGALLDHILEKRQEKVVIMGATSGDTGSAAIEGCRRCSNIDIFILHPYQRVSDVQRRQMTTVLGENIHNLAIKGNFDDCQQMVKNSFKDQSFLKGQRKLVAVNSINWCRIMAQIVYYFYAGLNVGAPHKRLAFSVPTGNFGDIYAGYVAKKMGLPIEQLVIATNTNDILHRFVSQNKYEKKSLTHTLSPSMDIMVSSNFERLLFDVFDQKGEDVAELMEKMNHETVSIADEKIASIRVLFDSDCANDDQTCDTIKTVFDESEYLLDPHSAIGVKAARTTRRSDKTPMITLATAHPVKFPDALLKAGHQSPELPHHLSDLFDREERYEVLDHDLELVHKFMVDKAQLS